MQSAGYVSLFDNDQLANVDGLAGVSSLRQLHVRNNDGLVSLAGLENISSVEALTIWNNNALGSLDFPANLDSVGYVYIRDNDHLSDAENWIKKAVEADSRNDMMWNLGADYALYSQLCRKKHNRTKAKENLRKAIEIMKECGADGWVEKYEKEMAQL